MLPFLLFVVDLGDGFQAADEHLEQLPGAVLQRIYGNLAA